MKKSTICLLAGVAVVLTMASCKSQKPATETAAPAKATTAKEVKYAYEEHATRTIALEAKAVATTPITADITVKPVRYSWTETFDNQLVSQDVNNPENSAQINYMKDYTLSRAAKEAGADMLVAPLIDITTTPDFKRISVTVIGYPANYVNFRTPTDADFEMMRKVNRIGKEPMAPVMMPAHGCCDKHDQVQAAPMHEEKDCCKKKFGNK